MMLFAVPVSLSEANSFVDKYHRHHKPLKFHKYSIGVCDGKKLVGVCIVNRPVSINADDGMTLEIARVCTDGTKNACSFLMAKAAQAAKALGYRKIQTYTLWSETLKSRGSSQWAAATSWNTKKRKRIDKHPYEDKACWVRDLRQ